MTATATRPRPASPAALFRRIRARRNWPQKKLAARLGITRAQVCNVERGHKWPSGRVLWRAWGLMEEVAA